MPALIFREATSADLPHLVGMLADDPLGTTRERCEDPLPHAYHDAFATIDSDPANELVVVDREGVVVGFLQLTIIPNLTYMGRSRALIEGCASRPTLEGTAWARHWWSRQWAGLESTGATWCNSRRTRRAEKRCVSTRGWDSSQPMRE
jgi:hypothetical protein